MKYRWYSMSAEQTEKAQQTDVKDGLNSKEAENRIKGFGLNNVYHIEKGNSGSYMFHAFANLLALLLVFICGVEAVVKRSFYSLIPVVIIAASLTILYFVYVKSKMVLDRMAEGALPLAKVIRDGSLRSIKQNLVVPGDIIVLSSGDIVPCDARLIESDGLIILEKGVCHNNTPVEKDHLFVSNRDLPPEARKNCVFASTMVLKGSGRAIATETGKRCYVCSSGRVIPIYTCDDMSVLEGFKKVSRIVSTVMIALVFIITGVSLVGNLEMGIYDSFYYSISLAFSSLAELLPIFAVIIISCGIFGAGNKRHNINSGVDIKNAEKIQTLKDVDCIVFQKESLFCADNVKLELVLADGREMPCRDDISQAVSLITYGVVACGIYGSAYQLNKTDASTIRLSCEDEQIVSCAKQFGVYDKRLDEKYPPIFSGERVYRGRSYRCTTVKCGNRYDMYSACNPEAAMAVCSFEYVDNVLTELTPKRKAELLSLAKDKMKENCFVLAITYKKSVRNDYIRPGDNFSDNVFCGYLYIERPMQKGSAQLIKACREKGIKLVMFCKSIEQQDVIFALSSGIIKDKSECVDIAALAEMSDDLIRTNVAVYNMYGGLSTSQRRYVIERLKSDYGYTVAYLGSELSHLSGILTADTGIAETLSVGEKEVGKRGVKVDVNLNGGQKSSCEALKFVSDAVVSTPDKEGVGGLNSAVMTVVEAKGIYKNLTSMCRYVLTMVVFRVVMVLISLLTGEMFFTSSQLVFFGAICDMGAVILVAFEKHDLDILDWQKREMDCRRRALPLIWQYAVVSVLWSVITAIICSTPLFRTLNDVTMYGVLFISYIISQLVLLAEVSREESIFKGKIKMYTVYPVYLLIVALFFSVCILFPGIGEYAGVCMLYGIEWLYALIPPAILLVITECYKLIQNRDKISQRLKKKHKC